MWQSKSIANVAGTLFSVASFAALVFLKNQNASRRGCETGEGAKASCDVNRMREAYYFYSIPYAGAVCSHFQNAGT